ncbi:rhodanese-like domain-containing protein [Pseudonocardia sp. NPDC046786]|uniref:sulfurtransferase n=1 Tax=Pseudonocardia sp. NPDC046786 TaxID=3155471 RepID=UPI0033E502F9
MSATTPSLLRDPLLAPEDLLRLLPADDIAVLEIRNTPGDDAVRAGTVPGATSVAWKGLLWDDLSRLLATPEQLAGRLGALGVGDGTHLVLAGLPTQFAVYAYWVLTVRGFTAVSVLDGGLEAWAALDLPTGDPDAWRPPAARVLSPPDPLPGPEPLIGRDGVLAALGTDTVLLDLRSPEEYDGRRVAPYTAPLDHGAERHGHIPGARHVFFRELLDEHGRFLPAERIREVAAAHGIDAGTDVVTYCRLSHRASLGWFALTRVAGLSRVRVYDGSWTEWGSIVGFPVER